MRREKVAQASAGIAVSGGTWCRYSWRAFISPGEPELASVDHRNRQCKRPPPHDVAPVTIGGPATTTLREAGAPSNRCYKTDGGGRELPQPTCFPPARKLVAVSA